MNAAGMPYLWQRRSAAGKRLGDFIIYVTLSSKLQRKKNDSRQYPSLPCGSTHKSLSPAIQFIRDLDASFILAPSKGLQLALRQRKWLHRLVPAEVLQPLFLHAFAMSHLFTNLRCIPLSVLLAFIGGVLLVGSSGMETLKNFAYRPYIADILAVLKIVGSTAAALSLVLYLIRRTRAPFTRQSLAMIGLHAGLLAMVVSMGLDFALGFKGFVYIREGESAATWFDDL